MHTVKPIGPVLAFPGAAKSKVRVSMVYNLHGLLTLSQAQLMEELPAAPTSPATEEEKKDDGKSEPKSPSKAKDAPAEAGGKPDQPCPERVHRTWLL